MRDLRRWLTLSLSIVAALALACAALAAPGSLDPSFGGSGTVTSGIAPADNNDSIRALAIGADGKITVGGSADLGAGQGGVQFALAHYNPNGTLDTSFGSDGKLTTGSAPADRSDVINALVIAPDGKIIVGGIADMGAGQGGIQFALARYLPNGTPDTSFDNDGRLTTGIAPADGTDSITAIAITPDGKITVSGNADLGAGQGGFQFALARYNANGTPDTSFSDDGRLTTGIGPTDRFDSINAITVGPDGKITVGGTADMGGGQEGGFQFALARYNASGTPDTSFDNDGQLTTGIAAPDRNDFINAFAVGPDGKITVGGRAEMGSTQGGDQFAIARYDATGTLDASFDNDGRLTTSIAPADRTDVISALAIAPDGTVTVGGTADMGPGQGGIQFALARYQANGTPDTSFDSDGKLTTGIAPADGVDVSRALAITAEGRIIIAGDADMGAGKGGGQFALARINGLIPDTAITAGPAHLATISQRTPTFEFASTPGGASFQCSLDGLPYAPCSSPHTSAPLADGAHAFAVRATDTVGDADPTPATRSFAVSVPAPRDTAAPKARFSKKTIRNLGRSRTLVLLATCNEDCTLRVSPRITLTRTTKTRQRRTASKTVLTLARVTLQAKAGRQAQVRFKLSEKSAAVLRRARRSGLKASLQVTATATDTAGNARTIRTQIKARL